MGVRENVPYRDIEEKRESRDHVITPEKRNWFVCWLAICVALILANQQIAGIVCFFIGFFGARSYGEGLGYQIVRDVIKDWGMVSHNGKVFYPEGQADPQPDDDKFKEPINLVPTSFPNGDFRLGVIYDPETNSDVILGTGRGWSGAAMDPKDRYQAEDALADGLLEAAMQVEESVTISQIYSSVPLNPHRALDWNLMNLQKDVIAASEIGDRPPMTCDERLAVNYGHIDAINRLKGRDVFSYVGLSVARPANWPIDPKGNISDQLTERELSRAPIVQMANVLAQNLANNGVARAEVLDISDLNTYIRSSWDIAKIERWYNQLSNIKFALMRGDDVDTSVLYPWPESAIKAGHNYLYMDGTYHRVYRLARFLRRRIRPGEMLDLFYTGDFGPANETALTIAVCGHTVSSAQESKWLTRRIVWGGAARKVRYGEADRHVTMAERESQERLVKRQDAIFLGGNHVLVFNGYAVVSATSLDLLNDAETKFLAHARMARVRFRPIRRRSRQLRAFLAAKYAVRQV